MKQQITRLEDNLLWQEANHLAEYIYDLLSEMPREEDFSTTSKLRHSANDLLFAVAQAIGGGLSPGGAAKADRWRSV